MRGESLSRLHCQLLLSALCCSQTMSRWSLPLRLRCPARASACCSRHRLRLAAVILSLLVAVAVIVCSLPLLGRPEAQSRRPLRLHLSPHFGPAKAVQPAATSEGLLTPSQEPLPASAAAAAPPPQLLPLHTIIVYKLDWNVSLQGVAKTGGGAGELVMFSTAVSALRLLQQRHSGMMQLSVLLAAASQRDGGGAGAARRLHRGHPH